MKLSDTIAEYLDYCRGKTLFTNKGTINKSRALSPISTKHYKNILDLFLRHNGDEEIGSIKTFDYVSFMNHMEQSGWSSDNSRAMLRRILRRFFDVQVALNRIKKNPCEQILKEVVKIKGSRIYLTSEEYAKLLSVSLDVQSYLIFSFMGSYGLRMAEAVGNESEGGDIKGLTFADAQYLLDHHVVQVKGKGNKIRAIDTLKGMHSDWPNFFTLLRQYVDIECQKRKVKDGNESLFTYYAPEVNKKLRAYCRKIGIREITAHKLRHSFAMSGIAIMGVEALSEYMGHDDIKTTQIYAKMSRKAVREEVERRDLIWK